MDPKAPHKELLVETVIQSMMESPKGVTPLYSALHGYEHKLDFEVGEKYAVKKHNLNTWSEDPDIYNSSDCLMEVEVTHVAPFAKKEISIKYSYLRKDGTMKSEVTVLPKGYFTAIDHIIQDEFDRREELIKDKLSKEE